MPVPVNFVDDGNFTDVSALIQLHHDGEHNLQEALVLQARERRHPMLRADAGYEVARGAQQAEEHEQLRPRLGRARTRCLSTRSSALPARAEACSPPPKAKPCTAVDEGFEATSGKHLFGPERHAALLSTEPATLSLGPGSQWIPLTAGTFVRCLIPTWVCVYTPCPHLSTPKFFETDLVD